MSWVRRAYGCDCGAVDCRICHPEYFVEVECACCGKTVTRYDLMDDVLCEECYYNDAIQCEDCGEWTTNSVCCDGDFICEDCMHDREDGIVNSKCYRNESFVGGISKMISESLKKLEIESAKG